MSENNIYHRDIMHYESEIWSCADLLIASGIKQSKFPDYMMPFFALVMLEGRMRNEMRDITESEGIDRAAAADGAGDRTFYGEVGYKRYVTCHVKKRLTVICQGFRLGRHGDGKNNGGKFHHEDSFSLQACNGIGNHETCGAEAAYVA